MDSEKLKAKRRADKSRAKARRIMSKHLGRKLNGRVEYVHHKDHNPFNNDISNLELMSAGEHSSYHCRGPEYDIPRWKRKNAKAIKRASYYRIHGGWKPCHSPADVKNCIKCYRREQKRRLNGHQPKNINAPSVDAAQLDLDTVKDSTNTTNDE